MWATNTMPKARIEIMYQPSKSRSNTWLFSEKTISFPRARSGIRRRPAPRFSLKHMNKDLALVLKEAEGKNLFLLAAEAAYQVSREAVKQKGDLDLSAVTPYMAGKSRL